jgi:hypothetical protein
VLPCDLPGKRIDCRWIGKIAEDWKQAWVDIGKGTKPLAVSAIARPIPRVPPVIRIVRPPRLMNQARARRPV